jgi:hypothetical protein
VKIRLGELRSIIREEASETGPGFVELTDDPSGAHEAWPNVTWHGKSVVDDLYPQILARYDIKKKEGWDGQEVYLGYVPGNDTFVIGFDAWPPGEDSKMTSAWADFSMGLGGGGRIMFEPGKGMQTGAPGASFYSRDPDSGHNCVKEDFPGIIDLRLD